MTSYTPEALLALRPESKPRKYFVGKGLYLHIATNGTRTWRLKFRVAGREQLKSLGRFPAISLVEAQRRAIDIRAIVDANDAAANGEETALLTRLFREQDEAARVFENLYTFHQERVEHILALPSVAGEHVYFARAIGTSWVKIGHSSDPKKRLLSIVSCQPYDLELLATMPGGAEHEGLIHATFSAERIRGEWFTMSDRLNEFIARANAI